MKVQMKITIILLIMLLSISISLVAQTSDPPSGSGTSGDPYQIASLNNLYWVTQNSGEWNKYYIQTADIEASSTVNWDSGSGFSPIGNGSTAFTGSYNGQGYVIDSLFIHRPSTDYIGLFGFTYHSEIDSVCLTNVDITGDDRVGGLVGSIYYYKVSNSYSTGSVSGDM